MKKLNLIILILSITFSSCDNKRTEDFERKIELEGEHNFRDLGLYKTDYNKTIKKGLIYRSGSLDKLTSNDKNKLSELGIKTVVNFLTASEIEAQGGDKLPDGVNSVFLPIEGMGDEIDDLIIARKTGDFSKIPSDLTYKIHRILPESGKLSYGKLFEILADSTNYPIVFHCSHGVHRTGTAAALLLSTLNVPWQTVSEDYMLSNEYRLSGSKKRIHFLDSIAQHNPDIADKATNKKHIESFYLLQPEYIDGTKSHILNNYGSFESYLQSANISQEQMEIIKKILTE